LSRRVFRELVSVEEAKRRLYEVFRPHIVGVEKVSLSAAHGCILAEEIKAPLDVPPFDRATMDGYAVHAEDTFGADEANPIELKVIGSVEVGEKPGITLERSEAVEISTGAPVPTGANAVVMVEYTNQEGEILKVFRPVSVGENIMAAGSDIMAGETILRSGIVLTPRETGVLAALGFREIAVFRKPKIAVISTGNELVMPGESLPFGKIYDINFRSISDSVKECGGEPIILGIARDEMGEIRQKIDQAMEIGDAVLISGGTSAGVGDLLYRVIDDVGQPGILVHGISVRPGKPTIIAVADGKPIFSLPGHPTSALVIFNIFVAPIVRSMAGLDAELETKTVFGRTSSTIFTGGGRREYVPVNLVKTEEGQFKVYPVPGGSGAITSLAKSDGFIEVSESRTFLEEGETVEVRLFGSQIKPVDLMFIGSHCVGVNIILETAQRRIPHFFYKVINVGSSGGLTAIRNGEADIAGVHLLDEETGTYNIPFLSEYAVEDRAFLFRGYLRKQGLMVVKDNPKHIRGFEDLLRDDVMFINRNQGSGTRVLTDMRLRSIALTMGKDLADLTSRIKGYNAEAKSHASVAAAVALGKADVGIGIKAVAEQYKLEFIQVADEQYDFVVNAERLGKPVVKTFLEVLRSREFKEKVVEEAAGLMPTDETGRLVFVPKEFEQRVGRDFRWLLN